MKLVTTKTNQIVSRSKRFLMKFQDQLSTKQTRRKVFHLIEKHQKTGKHLLHFSENRIGTWHVRRRLAFILLHFVSGVWSTYQKQMMLMITKKQIQIGMQGFPPEGKRQFRALQAPCPDWRRLRCVSWTSQGPPEVKDGNPAIEPIFFGRQFWRNRSDWYLTYLPLQWMKWMCQYVGRAISFKPSSKVIILTRIKFRAGWYEISSIFLWTN